jgi:phenylalanine dehydrogenase
MTLKINYEKHSGYEMIVYFSDDDFYGYIAIHDTNLGPALGGCRIKPYISKNEALEDALRLSKGMTYKSSAAGLFLGGGKAVISAEKPTRDMMLKFGEVVNSLNGTYITAEDIGTTLEDILIVAEVSPYTVHKDGSVLTAKGVISCLKATLKYLNKSDDSLFISPLWVQGLGKVGYSVVEQLVDIAKSKNILPNIYVSDIKSELVAKAISNFGVKEYNDKIQIEIYVPCAMGQIITIENAATISYKIICGAANNQLADNNCAHILKNNGVLYCPDYIVNAGGVISAASEIYTTIDADEHVNILGEKLINVFKIADYSNITPLQAADDFMVMPRLGFI